MGHVELVLGASGAGRPGGRGGGGGGGELDTRAYYASEGREVAVLERRAEATVREFVAVGAGDSGVGRVELASVVVRRGPGGPLVSVELAAETPVGLLRLLGIVPPRMVGGATATARVVAP